MVCLAVLLAGGAWATNRDTAAKTVSVRVGPAAPLTATVADSAEELQTLLRELGLPATYIAIAVIGSGASALIARAARRTRLVRVATASLGALAALGLGLGPADPLQHLADGVEIEPGIGPAGCRRPRFFLSGW